MLARLVLVSCLTVAAMRPKVRGVREMLLPPGGAAELVQSHTGDSCTDIVLMDSTVIASENFRSVWEQRQAWAVFNSNVKTRVNNSTDHLSKVIYSARQVRQSSWCTVLVVVSLNPDFLVAFAEWSLRGRLLLWSTKLLVLTHVPLPQLQALLPAHWTFSMMNTVFLNMEGEVGRIRYGVYTYLPYSSNGSQVVKVAIWTPGNSFKRLSSVAFFEDKYKNFHGAKVNVTAGVYMPYWNEAEVRAPDGSRTTKYHGSDYRLLEAVASVLNFTIRVLPTSSWAETTRMVEERISLITPIIHGMLTGRTKRYDFTFSYEYGHLSFAMAKPKLEPRWKSLYYPLASEVWMALTIPLLLVPFALNLFMRAGQYVLQGRRSVSVGVILQDMVGLLLGQELSRRLSNSSSIRILVAAWLAFALILAVAYRGNLTAALTLPKYPPRPETLQQLINAADMLTIPSYGEQYRKYYSESESPLFQALARIMKPGPSLMEGFTRALVKKSGHVEEKTTLQYEILDKLTEKDGSTRLYVGQEPLIAMASGWPIPHDAPYKAHLDRWMMAALEAGLYDKWLADILTETKLKSQRRQQQRHTAEKAAETGDRKEGPPILTLSHIQGGFILLSGGLILAVLAFVREMLSSI